MNLQEEENKCIFVSSRGILKSCHIRSLQPISSIRQLTYYDFSNMRDGDTLYICTSAINHFINIIDKINKRFILVSGDCDEECSSSLFVKYQLKTDKEFQQFINNPNIIHWFSQNCTVLNHPKISQIPIGMDYHTLFNNKNHDWGECCSPLEQEKQLINIKENSLHFKDRIKICYANFHFNVNTKYGYDRKNAISSISKDLVYYEFTPTTRIDTWKHQSKMVFVISPHGNGLDCHRTWEALILGCIVIVKSSPLDSLYEGLPVLIVDNWNNITEELLDITMEKFSKMDFQYEKLQLKYWMEKIYNAKN